eukprot:TRINITY_DN866_c0_g1_i3.p1 TRINITY_DN866_c0_g1~~TRINITY_DN866_c0_g1_i3.p1  ORF type:complete len:268 (-),score=110.47 TRINITY_DN866_c0_g1_i3:170-973(-)
MASMCTKQWYQRRVRGGPAHRQSPVTPFAVLETSLATGSRKDALTQWWLDLIERSVDSWLGEQGYDFGVVPYNYIDHPPTSMHTLRANLSLLRRLLAVSSGGGGSGSGSVGNSAMAEELRCLIYNKIDEYADVVSCYLRYRVGDAAVQPPWVDTAAIGLTVGERAVVEECVGDLAYIHQMKCLELLVFGHTCGVVPHQMQAVTPPPHTTTGGAGAGGGGGGGGGGSGSSGSGGGMVHIIPVTGLIYNHLHRMENELKTAQEHWSNRS